MGEQQQGWLALPSGIPDSENTESAKDAKTDSTETPRFQNSQGHLAEGRVGQ